MNKELARALMVMGVVLAIGMSVAALIFGMNARHIGASKQTISVKGLAEKPIKADNAEWKIGVRVEGATFAEALANLRAMRPKLDEFLTAQGFDKASLKDGAEEVDPNMVEEIMDNGRSRQVMKGYKAMQDVTVTTKSLDKIESASKAVLQLEADGIPVYYGQPLYLVSNLEEVKMSLIGAATQNAKKRAEEFAKFGGTSVGSIRSASQGSFYILRVGADTEMDDYGGIYDKTTIDKIARVVVTIDYNIE